ncbi:tripartite tricarboxylate transporter substrate binding protein [Terrihabitans rhizophilus]|jgi:putative tricarboxylic transport membrane protein|uniref:Tripartite tricarboxylate transporter substrate binding protein n=1 Tax=Terrihabitans rhizophilus TaxID=3092662 RepID=A0ABU4RP39_9HYPH|nr:tripartite tricarboxylate transporter substrate binding protein [Terrihabitans sp. PJ23]MDX6806622.1 tripartite tricarboxylate transporter substrate binding protein [Terrihabitans sp. PJ23]
MVDLKSVLLAACVTFGLAAPVAAQDFRIVAPAAPGGGWDQTARSLQAALQGEGLGKNVQVVNVPGAGGTIGLAQFVNQSKADPKALIVGGYVMVGAVIANNAPVKLDQVTPIARLTGEYEAVVVPTGSDIKTMGDLVTKLKADPGAVSWGGGSAGGTDHIAVGLIAKAAGVEPTKINYIPFSGGGEALAAIVGGKVTAGISGYGEFEGQVKAGKLRVLGVSAPERQPNIDAPTFKESGVDVEVQNWRSVWAAPGITDAEKAQIIATFEKLNASETWKKTLETKGWANTFLAGDAFAEYLKGEIQQTTLVLKDIGLAK